MFTYRIRRSIKRFNLATIAQSVYMPGQNLLERHNPVLIEAAEAFIHFVKFHFKMLKAVAESKERFDAVQYALDESETSIEPDC